VINLKLVEEEKFARRLEEWEGFLTIKGRESIHLGRENR
jgi:hypothetical protein